MAPSPHTVDHRPDPFPASRRAPARQAPAPQRDDPAGGAVRNGRGCLPWRRGRRRRLTRGARGAVG